MRNLRCALRARQGQRWSSSSRHPLFQCGCVCLTSTCQGSPSGSCRDGQDAYSRTSNDHSAGTSNLRVSVPSSRWGLHWYANSSWNWQPLFLISMRCCPETETTFPGATSYIRCMSSAFWESGWERCFLLQFFYTLLSPVSNVRQVTDFMISPCASWAHPVWGHVWEQPLAVPAPQHFDPNQMLVNFPLWLWLAFRGTTPWHGATRRIGNSPLGVHSPIHTIFLTLCPVWRKEFSSILPVLNIILAWHLGLLFRDPLLAWQESSSTGWCLLGSSGCKLTWTNRVTVVLLLLSQVVSPTSDHWNLHPGVFQRQQISDDTIGRAPSSPLFTQEREEPAGRRQAYHSPEESLLSSQSLSVGHVRTGRLGNEFGSLSSSVRENPCRDSEKWANQDSSGTTKRVNSRWFESRDSETRVPSRLWQKKYPKIEWSYRASTRWD